MGGLFSKSDAQKPMTRGEKLVDAKLAKIDRLETTILDIQDVPIRDPGAQMVADYISQASCKCNTVVLRKNNISAMGVGKIAYALGSNKTITDLTITENKMGDQLPRGAQNIMEQGMNAGCYLVYGSESATYLATALKTHPIIRSVKLTENTLGNEGAEALAEVLHAQDSQTLAELALCKNEISDKGAQAIAKHLGKNRTITSLDLQENSIGDEGGAALAASLEKNMTMVKVNLRANLITAKGCGQIADMLRGNKTILELNLRRNNIRDEGCALVGQALEANNALKKLYLSSNLIGNEGVIKLSESLEKNTGLQELYMEINNIEDPGCLRFAEALERNGTLLKVDMKMNNFSGKSYNRLADAVEKNRNLQVLDLSNSLMDSKEPVKKMQDLLQGRSPAAGPTI